MATANIVMLGAPGSGKGTRSAILSEILGIPQISTGDIFRSNILSGTLLGGQIKTFMESGTLVPDNFVEKVVKERLSMPDCQPGFILDGFPRNLDQADILEKILLLLKKELTFVIYLEITKEEILKRIEGRLVCSVCQTSYNTKIAPTKTAFTCDKCGGKLITRPDDNPQTVLKRFKIFEDTTLPLVDYYAAKNKLVRLNSDISADGLKSDMLEFLGKHGIK